MCYLHIWKIRCNQSFRRRCLFCLADKGKSLCTKCLLKCKFCCIGTGFFFCLFSYLIYGNLLFFSSDPFFCSFRDRLKNVHTCCFLPVFVVLLHLLLLAFFSELFQLLQSKTFINDLLCFSYSCFNRICLACNIDRGSGIQAHCLTFRSFVCP